VHVPFGAYPSACHNCYDYDPVYFKHISHFAKDEKLYTEYLAKFVHGVKDHQGLLNLVGKGQLDGISADKTTGYAIGLDRR
jgi:glutaconate CoA-transferase subunit A